MSDAALSRAIMAAGGTKALGDAIGISSQAVSQWHICPPRRVLAVESVSGVSRQDLRPDLYPPASAESRPHTEGSQALDTEVPLTVHRPDNTGLHPSVTGSQSR